MNIHIVSEKDYEESLISSGHNKEQLDQAEHLVCDEFERCATLIYQELMNEQCPENVEIRLTIDTDVVDGYIKEGALLVRKSTPTNLVFWIFDSTIINVIEQGTENLHDVLMHELIHALDFEEVKRNDELLVKIDNKVKDYYCQQDFDSFMGLKPYLDTLTLLGQYRNEGVAIMISNILSGKPFSDNALHKNNLEIFSLVTSGIFMQTNPSIEPAVFMSAYGFAPNVLLEVLTIRGDVDDVLKRKIKTGMETGKYTMTTEEKRSLVKICRNLSLTEFVEGLILTDKEERSLVSIEPFLHFCSRIPQECSEDITAFRDMVDERDHVSKQVFIETMQNLIYETYSARELRRKYRKFKRRANEQELQFETKIDKMYQKFTTLQEGELKQLIQWGLTYFFADMDLISDDIPVYGLVDDIIVIDVVLKILEKDGQ